MKTLTDLPQKMNLFHSQPNVELWEGSCMGVSTLESESVNSIVTSPPYWGRQRDYEREGQFGQEKTPEEYVSKLVSLFRECRRVLRKDGTLWLNLGDCYASAWSCGRQNVVGQGACVKSKRMARGVGRWGGGNASAPGLKEKDLVGIPWEVALALRRDGWYLRMDIIWSKPNAMPESVTDRPTKSHEYLFLLSKSERYWYDHEAIKTPAKESSIKRWQQDLESQAGSTRGNGGAKTNGAMKAVGAPKKDKQRGHSRKHAGFNDKWDNMNTDEQAENGANCRSVWEMRTAGYAGDHFATFPEELPRRCILAGCPVGGTVLDPFVGSGTTAAVALRLGRKVIGIDLNSDYLELAKKRVLRETPALDFVGGEV